MTIVLIIKFCCSFIWFFLHLLFFCIYIPKKNPSIDLTLTMLLLTLPTLTSNHNQALPVMQDDHSFSSSSGWKILSKAFCDNPTYLGVALDRMLAYRVHITKTKGKVSSRNATIQKLTHFQWGADPSTIHTAALALSYLAAEYACPVWERSKHERNQDSTLNEYCWIITGCLEPTRTDHLHILAGIASPGIRRAVSSQSEQVRQLNNIIPCSNTLLKCHTCIPEVVSSPPLLPSMTPLPTHAPVYGTTPSMLWTTPHRTWRSLQWWDFQMVLTSSGPFGKVLTAWGAKLHAARPTWWNGITPLDLIPVTVASSKQCNISLSAHTFHHQSQYQ